MWKDILILAGTFLPVAGPALAIVIGLNLNGWPRWAMLFLGPVVSVLPCYYYGAEIGYNGNMLFAALFAISAIFLVLYYPALVLYLLIRRLKLRKAN